MRIGELADRTRVPAKTIRYYESIGLLPPPGRSPNGYRDYDASTVDRLGFIRRAKASGLTLAEIGGVISVRDRGEAPCSHVEALIEARIASIETQIDGLTRLRAELDGVLERARNIDAVACDPTAICSILDDRAGRPS